MGSDTIFMLSRSSHVHGHDSALRQSFDLRSESSVAQRPAFVDAFADFLELDAGDGRPEQLVGNRV